MINNIQTTPGLGDNETKNSTSFLSRPQLFKPYNGSTCADSLSQWAELKSSFLAQAIITDDIIENSLVIFVQNIIKQLYTHLGDQTQFIVDFDQFIGALTTEPDYGPRNAYPVSQARAFTGNSAVAYEDVYILFNFVKFTMWDVKNPLSPQRTINNGLLWNPNTCIIGAITQYLIIHLLMQPIFNFLGMVRGDREDIPQERWNQVGITYIYHPALRRRLKNFPDYPIQPWLHPGNAQCKMPYWGKWGEKIRIGREQNNIWSSYMCGISGSTNFMLFSYILAIANIGTSNPEANAKDLFTLAVAILTGDGGHNVREVIYGITLSIILLNTLFNELNLELRNSDDDPENTLNIKQNVEQNLVGIDFPRGPIVEALYNRINSLISDPLTCNINPTLNNDIPNRNLFILKDFLGICGNLESFITAIFNFTEDLNIVGISATDLNAYDPDILTDPQESYNEYKDAAIKYLLDIPNTDNNLFTGVDNLTQDFNEEVQVFLALESNRYLHDNWENGANTKMEQIIRGYSTGEGILQNINDLTNKKLRECNQVDLLDRVPFAFPKPRNKKKNKN